MTKIEVTLQRPWRNSSLKETPHMVWVIARPGEKESMNFCKQFFNSPWRRPGSHRQNEYGKILSLLLGLGSKSSCPSFFLSKLQCHCTLVLSLIFWKGFTRAITFLEKNPSAVDVRITSLSRHHCICLTLHSANSYEKISMPFLLNTSTKCSWLHLSLSKVICFLYIFFNFLYIHFPTLTWLWQHLKSLQCQVAIEIS